MVSIQIEHLKGFMADLLTGSAFDTYDVEEVTITTFNTFHIDGRIRKEFYSQAEAEEEGIGLFSKWKDLRPICFDLIKGKKAPLSFKIVLHLCEEEKKRLIEENDLTYMAESIGSFVLTLRYEKGTAEVITGCAMNTFIPDKTPDHVWDRVVTAKLSQ